MKKGRVGGFGIGQQNEVRFARLFFFFSSRRRHTRFDCDWSSDVCSSDLLAPVADAENAKGLLVLVEANAVVAHAKAKLGRVEALKLFHVTRAGFGETLDRSEERRVGKECRSRWSPYH